MLTPTALRMTKPQRRCGWVKFPFRTIPKRRWSFISILEIENELGAANKGLNKVVVLMLCVNDVSEDNLFEIFSQRGWFVMLIFPYKSDFIERVSIFPINSLQYMVKFDDKCIDI